MEPSNDVNNTLLNGVIDDKLTAGRITSCPKIFLKVMEWLFTQNQRRHITLIGNNEVNYGTLTIKILLSTVLFISIFIATIPYIAYGQISGGISERIDVTNPSEISDVDITRANQIALADEQVQKYIAGRPYYLMNHGITSNENEPSILYPTLLYTIDNKDQLSVTVDLRTGTVKEILYYPDFMPKFVPAVTKEQSTNVMLSNIITIAASIIGGAIAAFTIFYLKLKSKKEVLK